LPSISNAAAHSRNRHKPYTKNLIALNKSLLVIVAILLLASTATAAKKARNAKPKKDLPPQKPVTNLTQFYDSFREKNTRNNNEPVGAPKDKVKILIFMGQSNMVGHGAVRELTGDYEKYGILTDKILMLQDNGWVRLGNYRLGPEIACAYELAEKYPDHTIGVIKIAWGGTNICAFLPDWKKEKAGKLWYKGSL
jgi:hypothetical protein